MTKDSEKIYFSLPGFWQHFDLNVDLLGLYASQRNLFYDDIVIDSFYDCFPCIWNGGRPIMGNLSEGNIRATVEPFERAGVSLRLTFTNLFIEPEDLRNHGCNMVCRLLESEHNGVNARPGILRDYIKEKYPKFYHINSTTMQVSDVDRINELSQDTLTVPDYQINNDFDALARLKYPQNIELLVLERCIEKCPLRRKHNEHASLSQKGMNIDIYECPFVNPESEGSVRESIYDTAFKRGHNIPLDDIRKKYLPLGFNQFKLCGRGELWFDVVERYVAYLVKPEHRDFVRSKLACGVMMRGQDKQ